VLLEKALSEAELDELDAILTSDAVSEDCMDVSELHGFLTALVTGPSTVLPSEWLPVVWSEPEGPVFESEQDAARIIGLIFRLLNSIAATLEESPEKFLPVLYEEKNEEGKPELNAKGWCQGFLMGPRLREKDWEPLLEDRECGILLVPILALESKEAMEELLAGSDEPKLTREEFLAMIPLSVAALQEYWRGRRTSRGGGLKVNVSRPGRRARIGRNDPCPCGSGKKYKKCCGAGTL